MLLEAMSIMAGNGAKGKSLYEPITQAYDRIIDSFEQAKYAGSKLSLYDRALASKNSKAGKVFEKVSSVTKTFVNYMLLMPLYTAIRAVAGDVVGTAIMISSKGLKVLPDKTENETYNKLKDLGIFGIVKAFMYSSFDKIADKKANKATDRAINKINDMLSEYDKDLGELLENTSKESETEKYVTEKLRTRGIQDVDVVVKDGKLYIQSASETSIDTLNADLLIQEVLGIQPDKDGYYDISKVEQKISQETMLSMKTKMALTQDISDIDDLVETVVSLSIYNKDMLKGITLKDMKKLSVFKETVEKANKENGSDGKMTKVISSLTQEDVKQIINSNDPKLELNKKIIQINGNVDEVKELMKIIDTSDMSKEQIVKLEETLGVVVNGVTAPEQVNMTVSAVLAICKNADEIAQLMGYKDIKEIQSATVEDIVSKYNEKVGQVFAMDEVDQQDIQAAVKILSVTRDMLIMVKKDESMIEVLNNPKTTVEDIMSKLVISKSVNQNVVVQLVKESVGRNDGDKDFVIDIEKIKKSVTEKIEVVNAKDKLEELGLLLMQGRGAGKKSMPISLMKLSDIRAVAAAA